MSNIELMEKKISEKSYLLTLTKDNMIVVIYSSLATGSNPFKGSLSEQGNKIFLQMKKEGISHHFFDSPKTFLSYDK